MNKTGRADAQGFLAHPLHPQEISNEELLDLMVTTSTPPFGDVLRNFQSFKRTHEEFVRRIEKQCPRFRMLYNWQHPPTMEGEFYPQLLQLSAITNFRGIVSGNIAYNGQNAYGAGWSCPEIGLTKRGRELVKAMWNTGMVVDLCHCSRQVMIDVVDMSKDDDQPIIYSHGTARGVYPHPGGYGIEDDIAIAIASRGGYVGVSSITFFLDPEENGIRPMLQHIEHLVDVVGENHVVIGSDSPYQGIVDWEGQTKRMIHHLDTGGAKMEVRFPDYIPELVCPGKMEILFMAIQERLETETANKICGANLLEFWKF